MSWRRPFSLTYTRPGCPIEEIDFMLVQGKVDLIIDVNGIDFLQELTSAPIYDKGKLEVKQTWDDLGSHGVASLSQLFVLKRNVEWDILAARSDGWQEGIQKIR